MKSRMWHVTMIEPRLSKDWNNYWRLIRSVSIGKIDGIFSMVLNVQLYATFSGRDLPHTQRFLGRGPTTHTTFSGREMTFSQVLTFSHSDTDVFFRLHGHISTLIYTLPLCLSPLRRTGGQDVTGWPANPKLVRHLKSTLIRTGVHVDEAVMGLSVHTDKDGGGDNPLLSFSAGLYVYPIIDSPSRILSTIP